MDLDLIPVSLWNPRRSFRGAIAPNYQSLSIGKSEQYPGFNYLYLPSRKQNST